MLLSSSTSTESLNGISSSLSTPSSSSSLTRMSSETSTSSSSKSSSDFADFDAHEVERTRYDFPGVFFVAGGGPK